MDMVAARNNMVDSQIRTDDVTAPSIVSAFLKVPREAFVPKSKAGLAYSELEIETSPGRTLWTPRDFAKLLDAVAPRPSDVALVLGAGAGYECAVLNEIVDTVIGLETDEAVISDSTTRLTSLGYDHVALVGGALGAGLPEQGPYDIILVNGMVETVPDTWTKQLSEGGRLGVVVDTGRVGKARVYRKSGKVAAFRTVFDATPPKFAEFDAPRSFSL